MLVHLPLRKRIRLVECGNRLVALRLAPRCYNTFPTGCSSPLKEPLGTPQAQLPSIVHYGQALGYQFEIVAELLEHLHSLVLLESSQQSRGRTNVEGSNAQ